MYVFKRWQLGIRPESAEVKRLLDDCSVNLRKRQQSSLAGMIIVNSEAITGSNCSQLIPLATQAHFLA
jgi:hypothetical protein